MRCFLPIFLILGFCSARILIAVEMCLCRYKWAKSEIFVRELYAKFGEEGLTPDVVQFAEDVILPAEVLEDGTLLLEPPMSFAGLASDIRSFLGETTEYDAAILLHDAVTSVSIEEYISAVDEVGEEATIYPVSIGSLSSPRTSYSPDADKLMVLADTQVGEPKVYDLNKFGEASKLVNRILN